MVQLLHVVVHIRMQVEEGHKILVDKYLVVLQPLNWMVVMTIEHGGSVCVNVASILSYLHIGLNQVILNPVVVHMAVPMYHIKALSMS